MQEFLEYFVRIVGVRERRKEEAFDGHGVVGVNHLDFDGLGKLECRALLNVHNGVQRNDELDAVTLVLCLEDDLVDRFNPLGRIVDSVGDECVVAFRCADLEACTTDRVTRRRVL